NPAKRVQAARDSRRAADAESLLTAIHEYLADKGTFPQGLTAGMTETQLGTSNGTNVGNNPICAITTGGCNVTTSACVNLTTPLAPYLKSIPADPKSGSAAATLYSVAVDTNNIITVKACGTETRASTTPYIFGTLNTDSTKSSQEVAAGVNTAEVD